MLDRAPNCLTFAAYLHSLPLHKNATNVSLVRPRARSLRGAAAAATQHAERLEVFTVRNSMRTRLLWLGSAVVLGSAALFAQAPKPAAKPPAAAPVSAPANASGKAHELTADDVGAFLDGFMPQEIEHADIAGAVIAVVKDGKLLYAKGYGYSDVAKKAPVSPETTLFRPGSISK